MIFSRSKYNDNIDQFEIIQTFLREQFAKIFNPTERGFMEIKLMRIWLIHSIPYII